MRRDLVRPALLGSFDGTNSLLGVIVFLLLSHPSLIFPAALSGAVSSALSMGAGWWLSDDNRDGLAGSSVMGVATLTGALVPALPFAFGAGPSEIAISAVLCTCIGLAVAVMRPGRGFGLALTETFGLLAVVLGVTVALGMVLPGGAG